MYTKGIPTENIARYFLPMLDLSNRASTSLAVKWGCACLSHENIGVES